MIVFVDSFLGCHLVQGLQARKNGEIFHGLVINSAIKQTRDWIQLRHSNVIELSDVAFSDLQLRHRVICSFETLPHITSENMENRANDSAGLILRSVTCSKESAAA